MLLVTRGTARRGAAAGALAMLAGNALVLVGFKRIIDRLGSSPYTSYRLPDDAVHIGAGYPLAAAATAMLAAGAIVAVRGLAAAPAAGRRRRSRTTAPSRWSSRSPRCVKRATAPSSGRRTFG